MKLASVALLFALVSFSVAAEVSVPVKTTVCYKTKGLVDWNYTFSGNSTNGEQDRKVYVELKFAPTLVDGRMVSTMHRVKAPGLFWDKNFKRVVFSGADYTTVCGVKRWYGVKKYKKNCDMRAALTDTIDADRVAICGDDAEAAVTLNAEIVVK